jgi:hypothetical protein
VSRSFSEVNGRLYSLVVTSIPIALTIVALAWPSQQKRAAYALLVFVVLAGMSIGLLYAPAAVALLLLRQRPQ